MSKADLAKNWVRVILNPKAGQGRARAKLGEIERALASYGGRSEILVTHGPGHAASLARAAHAEGVNVIAVVGGDGTLNEVLQAYIDDHGVPRPGPDLALIPCGTGGDWRRTVGIHADTTVAVARAVDGRRKRVDFGVVRFEPHAGQAPIRAFLNVASFGLSGAVDSVVKGVPRVFGGKPAFFVASLRALARFSNPSVRVRVDDVLFHEGPSMTVALANGRFFGAGMMIAPDADPSDGKLEVVSLGDLSKREAVGLTPQIYSGTHLHVHGVTTRRGVKVEAEAMYAWEEVLVDVDGEQPGKLPLLAELHAGALTFRV